MMMGKARSRLQMMVCSGDMVVVGAISKEAPETGTPAASVASGRWSSVGEAARRAERLLVVLEGGVAEHLLVDRGELLVRTPSSAPDRLVLQLLELGHGDSAACEHRADPLLRDVEAGRRLLSPTRVSQISSGGVRVFALLMMISLPSSRG